MTSRRSFLIGAASLLAAPAIVRAESLMKLYVPRKPEFWQWPLNQTIITKLEYADTAIGPAEYGGFDVFWCDAQGFRALRSAPPVRLGYEAILERLRA